MCSNVDDFNNRNLFLTAKLLKQGYRYHKIRKAFSEFYHRHSELIVKYDIGLKTLLLKGISEPIFYGDLVYKFKRIVGKPNFSDQFKKIVKRYLRVGYTRPSSPVRQDGERRTTLLDEYAFRRVPFFSFWLIFLCAYH